MSFIQRLAGHWNRLPRNVVTAASHRVQKAFGQSSQAHGVIFGASCIGWELDGPGGSLPTQHILWVYSMISIESFGSTTAAHEKREFWCLQEWGSEYDLTNISSWKKLVKNHNLFPYHTKIYYMEILFHFLFLIFAKGTEKSLSDLLKVNGPLQYSYILTFSLRAWGLLWTVPGIVRDEEFFFPIGVV